MMQKKRNSGWFWIAFKWGLNLGVFNTAIYGKIVQCFFKSFEQCINNSLKDNICLFQIF